MKRVMWFCVPTVQSNQFRGWVAAFGLMAVTRPFLYAWPKFYFVRGNPTVQV